MIEAWVELGRPDVETMLAEIAAIDVQAAVSVRVVWEQIEAYEQPQWRELVAAAVLSYRRMAQSRIGEKAVRCLARMRKQN